MNEAAPLVSVIVPMHNAEQHLFECLQSIVGQSFCDFELIIVDDGSTDNSVDIASALAEADARVRIISQPNSGQSLARNRGLDAACGKWVAFVDADDSLHPRYLELLLALAVDGVEIAACDFYRGLKPKWSISSGAILFPDGKSALYDMLYQRHINSALWSKLMLRRLFDDNRCAAGLLYEDLDVLSRIMMQCGKVAYAPYKIYFYRDNPTSFVGSFKPSRLDVLKVTADICVLCKGNPTLETAAADRQFAANYNMFVLASRSGNSAAESCWQTIRRLRWSTMRNPQSRLKNRIGALLSYLGRPAVLLASKLVYKS